MKPRIIILAGAVVLAAACTTQPVLLPSRDFDRPTDMTFVCMQKSGVGAGADAAVEGDRMVSGRPMRECHPRNLVDPTDNTIYRTFAFVPNSSSGDLTVLDADHWSLVNLDPSNPGFNRLPLGVLPTQIAASDDGCRVVTANQGSCDLSLVDPAALLAPTLSREENHTVTAAGPTNVINRVPHLSNGRELRVRAGELAFLPTATLSPSPGEPPAMVDPKLWCPADHQWQVLATFPSCDLVALIDLPSGAIQKAAKVEAHGGVVSMRLLRDDEDPACPVDCIDAQPAADGGSSDAVEAETSTPDAGPPEAGTTDAGAPEAAPPPAPTEPGDVPFVGPPSHPLAPGPLAIEPESGRAYVGLANAAFVLAFNVDEDKLDLSSAGAIPLHEGALGVNRLRLSIDPYKDKTAAVAGGIPTPRRLGAFVGNDMYPDREYLYVVARDGTLRVVHVSGAVNEAECETNLDYAAIADPTARAQAKKAACPPVTGTGRRAGATGPGLTFPAPPVDIAVADVRPTMPDTSETSVSGAHAWVLTANGQVYLVNLDPQTRDIFWVNSDGTVLPCTTPGTSCLHEADDPPSPNSVRNRSFVGFTPALDPSLGPARIDITPGQPSIGPRVEPVWTVGSAANATATSSDYNRTYVRFPDPNYVTPQPWTLTWQGALMANPRFNGQILKDKDVVLVDQGNDFCRLGTQNRDLVTLVGCTADSQCGLGNHCALGSNGAEGAGGLPITGLCLPTTTNSDQCDDLLSTVRRYEIPSAQQHVLPLVPHKDELVRPLIKPCVVKGAQTDGGADGGTDAGQGEAGPPTDAGPDGGAAPIADAAAVARDGAGDASRDAVSAETLASMVPKSDCQDVNDPTTAKFACLPDPDGIGTPRRCLMSCNVAGDTAGCRTGRICVAYGPRPDPQPHKKDAMGNDVIEACDTAQCFCADGPDLMTDNLKAEPNTCLRQLLAYQVSMGRGFLVAGGLSGTPVTGQARTDGTCGPLDRDIRDQNRLSMDAPLCDPDNVSHLDEVLDSRCDPDLTNLCAPGTLLDPKTTAAHLSDIQSSKNDPNPCLFGGGPNETDPVAQDPQLHVRGLFRNREVEFMVTNLERPPSGAFQLRFDVHGGFQPQTVLIPGTVEVTAPARIILGPFDSNAQTATPTMQVSEAPYLFVVDQRRLGRSQGGGPTRGQLLRISPRGFQVASPVIGYQPLYEDLSHSGNLFPIQ
jgi:hypothetical protein